jgi:hypothetical protein
MTLWPQELFGRIPGIARRHADDDGRKLPDVPITRSLLQRQKRSCR